MIYFTSDHHFGHKNIIKACNRPFYSVDQMDKELIKRWNEVVKEDDIVYYLGDFTLKSNPSIYLKQLKGNIKFIDNSQHHDHWQKKYRELLPAIYSIKYNDTFIVMSHFPLLVWNRKNYGAIHLHGHSHGKLIYNERALDVGVDSWDYYPISIDFILGVLKNGF